MVTGRKIDTGHPFGLIHQDGHVVMAANSAGLVPRVDAMRALLAEFGLQDWHLDWLTSEAATVRYVAALNCSRCQIRLSCGCDIMTDVLAGNCPHGSAKAIQAAARRCGYLEVAEATGGPLAASDWVFGSGGAR